MWIATGFRSSDASAVACYADPSAWRRFACTDGRWRLWGGVRVAVTEWIALALLQAIAEVLPLGAATQLSFVNAWSGLLRGTTYNLSLTPALGLGIRLGLALNFSVARRGA